MSASWNGLRVLLVEDDVLTAMPLVDHLSERGAHILGPVGDLNRALQLAKHAQLSGAILDVNIHGGDVWPVAGVLISRHIPIVFATGTCPTSAAACFGNVPWFNKPYDPAAVADALLACILATTSIAMPDSTSLSIGSYCCSPARTMMAV